MQQACPIPICVIGVPLYRQLLIQEEHISCSLSFSFLKQVAEDIVTCNWWLIATLVLWNDTQTKNSDTCQDWLLALFHDGITYDFSGKVLDMTFDIHSIMASMVVHLLEVVILCTSNAPFCFQIIIASLRYCMFLLCHTVIILILEIDNVIVILAIYHVIFKFKLFNKYKCSYKKKL